MCEYSYYYVNVNVNWPTVHCRWSINILFYLILSCPLVRHKANVPPLPSPNSRACPLSPSTPQSKRSTPPPPTPNIRACPLSPSMAQRKRSFDIHAFPLSTSMPHRKWSFAILCFSRWPASLLHRIWFSDLYEGMLYHLLKKVN